MKHSKIELYRSKKNGQFAWRMIAKNGKKIACGGETYHNKKDCIKSLRLVESIFCASHVANTEMTLLIDLTEKK